jgi:hypothetical protein
MEKKEEFYVGYQEQAPAGLQRFLRIKVSIILSVVFLVAILFSFGQADFKNSNFELGNLRLMEGTFYANPYPMMRTTGDNGETLDVMLVGFGKFGAELEPLHP